MYYKTLFLIERRIKMKINFGKDSTAMKYNNSSSSVIWDSQKVINGHMLLVGKSGTGKTYTFRNVIQQLQEQSQGKLRVHIIDVHGDIDIENASTVKFSESTNYGFNPIAINPDPDFGGVRKKIQSFIAALNRSTAKLGHKQESVLRNILVDLYNANGFYDGRPDTWRIVDSSGRPISMNGKEKRNPTLSDAYRYANFKLRGMFLGTSNKSVAHLEQLNRKVTGFYKKQKTLIKATNDSEKQSAEKEILDIKQQCIESYTSYIQSIENGMELSDLIRYDSKDVMKSVVEKLENLNAIGIFKPEPPPFNPNASVWRYDIKALNLPEKKLFVSFVLDNIFYRRVQEGVQDDLREIIILDEAHNFFSDDTDNIVNIIAKEARKFGLGLFCASQSPTHFSEDFISNVGTKIILGIDQTFWNGSVQKLKIEQSALEWIIPHKKMVLQINNKGELRNKFIWAYI